MQITESLIERFLANQCTAAEADAVADYLSNNPAVLAKHLKATWDDGDQKEKMPETYHAEMLEAIREKTTIAKGSLISRNMKWLAIAASLLLIAGTLWVLQGRPAINNKVVLTEKNAVTQPKWIINKNATSISEKLTLTDGTIVTLSPNTEIRYMEKLTGAKRDIFLKGEALFEVAKDRIRPFTVHAGSFSTTALGTVFRVIENKASYCVKLYEGRVVIKSLNGKNKDVFLAPGQQLKYDISGSIAVSNFNEEKRRSLVVAKKVAKKKNNALVFQNSPLDEVLLKLSEQYKEGIDYNKTEIAGMYFSGTVLEKDSLEVILKVIGQMNSLTITEKAGGFLIKKSQ